MRWTVGCYLCCCYEFCRYEAGVLGGLFVGCCGTGGRFVDGG